MKKLSVVVKQLTHEIESKNKEIHKLRNQHKEDRHELSEHKIDLLKLKKFSGELNDQILNHINDNLGLKKEIIGLNKQISDKKIISDNLEMMKRENANLIEKYETLLATNEKEKKKSTLVQEKLNRYIKQSREDTHTIEKNAVVISRLENLIEEQKEKYELSISENQKTVIKYCDDIKRLKSAIGNLSNSSNTDEYCELLIEQNQENSEKIKQLNDTIALKNKEIKRINKDFETYKMKILKMISSN